MGTLKKVYIVHGWSYSTEKWQECVHLLEARGVNVEILHVPGLTSPSDKTWALEDYVEWINKETRRESEPIILIGNSNGGRLAMAFARRYPNRVERLILIDSAGIYHKDLRSRFKRSFFKSLAKTGKRFSQSDRLRRLLYSVARERDYLNAKPNMRQTMANLLESDKQLDLNKITMPTTIIWGDQDQITPLSDGEALNRGIAKSNLKIIAGAQHAPYFSHADQTARIILEAIR